ncbi:hypothetical protein BH23BAC3_BH23BAC3_01250 [soil metagenome]
MEKHHLIQNDNGSLTVWGGVGIEHSLISIQVKRRPLNPKILCHPEDRCPVFQGGVEGSVEVMTYPTFDN